MGKFLDEEQAFTGKFLDDERTTSDTVDSPVDNNESKKFLAEQLGIPQLLEDSIVGPIAETLRGFSSSTSALYGKLDSIAKFVHETTGTPKVTIFKAWEESARETAESIPETQQNPFNKFVFQTAGSTIPIITEFAAVKGGNVAKFATLEAIEEYGKLEDPNFVEGGAAILKGAVHGATVGMAFSAAPALFTKARDLLKRAGNSAVKKFMTFLTGNKDLAKDFVKNPNKYDVFGKDVFGKDIKTKTIIEKENQIVKQGIKDKHGVEKETFKFKQGRDKVTFDNQLRDAKGELGTTRAETIADMASKKKTSLESIMKTNERAIQNSNQYINQKATGFADDALNKYNLLKKQKGEAVGSAVELATQQNPGFAIPFSKVNKKIRSLVKKSPFKFVGKSGSEVLQPSTAISADSGDIKQINALMNELRSKKSDGFGLQYLQDLKKAAQEKAAIANKAGKHEVRIFWQDLAKEVNPANIVSGDKALSSQFKGIAEANGNFATFIKKYDRAMDGFYKKNAVGEYVPDINKALSNVARNDTVAIREMKLADAALAKDDRLLPKFTELLNQADDLALKQKANVKLVKRRFELEAKAFKKSSKEATDKLSKEQRFASNEEKNRGVTKLREYTESKNAEYNVIEKELEKSEEYYGRLDTLRGFSPSSSAAAILQRLLGFGGILPLFTGRASSGTAIAAAGFFALSPKFASPAIKSAIRTGQVIGRGGQAILNRPEVGQVIGTKILRENQ